eukprot:scaffold145289_cov160-Phaeocystis_antarctica.AAC.1
MEGRGLPVRRIARRWLPDRRCWCRRHTYMRRSRAWKSMVQCMAHHTVVQRVGRHGRGCGGAQRTSRFYGRPPAYPPTRRPHWCTGCAVRSARSCRNASAGGSRASSSHCRAAGAKGTVRSSCRRHDSGRA